MAKRDKKTNKKVSKITTGNIIAIIIIVLAAVFLIYTFYNNEFINCKQDADCKVVYTRLNANPCCWDCGYESINITLFDLRQDFFEENCKDVSASECPRCAAYEKDKLEAYCSKGICALRTKNVSG